MTYVELQIEVLSELTGDSKLLVSDVVFMMQTVLINMGVEHAFMNEEIPFQSLEVVRQKLLNDDTLISWYKKGLRYYNTVNQQGGTQ